MTLQVFCSGKEDAKILFSQNTGGLSRLKILIIILQHWSEGVSAVLNIKSTHFATGLCEGQLEQESSLADWPPSYHSCAGIGRISEQVSRQCLRFYVSQQQCAFSLAHAAPAAHARQTHSLIETIVQQTGRACFLLCLLLFCLKECVLAFFNHLMCSTIV